MNKCPHCDQPSIKTWKKVNATKAFPVKCAKFKQLSFLPAWWHFGSAISFEVVFWGSVIAALGLLSYFPLLLFPVVILVVFTGGKRLSLIPTNQREVRAERKKCSYYYRQLYC